jgi:predicted Fe-Mo cluster-binding NifX family protein
MGTVPEAWVGIKFGVCSQFLVFDLDTMEYVVLSVPPRQEGPDQVSLTAIRAVAQQEVAAVITGDIKDVCRRTLLDLGIDVIDGVEGMTVAEAIERYRATGLQAPEERKGILARIAVASQGEGLDAPLENNFRACTSFVVVDPRTKDWVKVGIEPSGPEQTIHVEAIRAVARSGATVLITPQARPECCMALQALAIEVYIAPEGITVQEAIELYEAGELEPSSGTSFGNL